MVRHTVTETGGTLRAAVGDEIIIELPERATAGYEWHFAEMLPAALEEIRIPQEPNLSPAIGADALRAILLRVKETGTHRVRLLHYRPWEGPERSSNSFALDIVA